MRTVGRLQIYSSLSMIKCSTAACRDPSSKHTSVAVASQGPLARRVPCPRLALWEGEGIQMGLKVHKQRGQRLSTPCAAAQQQDQPAAAATSYDSELQAAIEAVRLASRICKAVQLQLSEQEKQTKNDDSPVTVADYAAQAVVAWSLSRSLPGEPLGMVAEETSEELRLDASAGIRARITELVNSAVDAVSGAQPLTEEQVLDLVDLGSSPGGAVGRHWVLDPIDGTRGFVGMRQYAVCLGLLQDGEVLLGVLGCPNVAVDTPMSDEAGGPMSAQQIGSGQVGVMFAAVRGHGAFMGPLEGGMPSQPIRVVESEDFGSLRFMESYESRHSDHKLAGRVAQAVGLAELPLRVDSQVKYGVLSRGDASVFMRFPPPSYKEKIWDHVAGAIIVEEAGGRITDASGKRLDFSQGRYLELDRGIVAATPAVHAAIIRALQDAHL